MTNTCVMLSVCFVGRSASLPKVTPSSSSVHQSSSRHSIASTASTMVYRPVYIIHAHVQYTMCSKCVCVCVCVCVCIVYTCIVS